tara:strand:- start:1370 stop:1726 length:357 start_codon:yes stop_codon:yes gene_type:complete
MAAQVFPAIPPHVGSSQTKKYRMLESDLGDGYVQAAGDGLNATMETLPLVWNEEDLDDINTIKAFLNSHGPLGTPFLFTPAGETQQLYRCKAGWTFQWSGPDSGTFTASFERWFGSTP